MDSESAWDLLDAYFRDHAYPFTRHHIESFRQFLKHHVPLTIKSYNPIVMVKYDTAGEEDLKVEVFVGGLEGKDIHVDRPTTAAPDGSPLLLTPNDARMRDTTYDMNLLADIIVRYTIRGVVAPLKVFGDIVLGQIPIMLHSDACVLHAQGAPVLRALGECPYDQGGYFVMDGKEKVIISAERMSTNRLFVEMTPDDDDVTCKARIMCTGETGETALVPRTTYFRVARGPIEKVQYDSDDDATASARTNSTRPPKGTIWVTVPGVNGDIALAQLFRALGVISDEAILEHILGGPITDETPAQFLQFLRPSLAHAATKYGSFTRDEVWQNLQQRVYFRDLDYVQHVLSNDLFPNMNDDTMEWRALFKRKARYLGHLIYDMMLVHLNVRAESDRDSYAYKRVHVSGMLLSTLFQEAYARVRDLCRRLLDREYHYGSYKNTGNMTDLIREDNIHYYLPSSIMTESFRRSLKGAWGLKEDMDPDQGIVQDLTRISYIGYLSHVRRVNNDLDPTVKMASPHRLHPQQWGIMCPFESPDGAAIGYLKNFALLAQVTFGTSPEAIRKCLVDLGTSKLQYVNFMAERLCRVENVAGRSIVVGKRDVLSDDRHERRRVNFRVRVLHCQVFRLECDERGVDLVDVQVLDRATHVVQFCPHIARIAIFALCTKLWQRARVGVRLIVVALRRLSFGIEQATE